MHSCVIVIKNYVICLYTKEIKLLKTGCFINPNLISKQISYFNLEIKVWYVIKHKNQPTTLCGNDIEDYDLLTWFIRIIYYHDTQHEEKYEI